MSVELNSVSGSGLTQDGVQAAAIGGSKPLHRFLRGHPKIIGNIILVLGASFFIITVGIITDSSITFQHVWSPFPPSLLLGILFIVTGTLYILTDHNPTKKTVTISLALSIISILGVFWANIQFWPLAGHYRSFRMPEVDYDDNDNKTSINLSQTYIENMTLALESIVVFYSLVGGVILIVMSCLAGAALRFAQSQAIVMVTAVPMETSAMN